MHHFIKFCLLSVCLFAVSCASMQQSDGSLKVSGKLSKPSAIYVKRFEPGTNWTGDFGKQTKEAFIQSQMEILDQRLLFQLPAVAPTRLLPSALPTSGLLVTGKILHVNAGSGAARYFIGGFGGGAREVVTEVQIFDLANSSTQPVVTFKLEGGSRGEGGIIGAVSNLDSEWDRTARETRDYLLKNAK